MIHNKYRDTVVYVIVYSELITAAKYRGTLTYPEIAQMMGIPLRGGRMAQETGLILGEISENEVSNRRPMLSAIAVSSVNGKPGPGFFNFARELGKLAIGDDENKFWQKECHSVYETWKAILKSKE